MHKIALLLVPDMLSYKFFLGWHVFKANMTALLYFKCVECFESHVKFFSFKFNFLGFSNNFVPDFENLYYLLHEIPVTVLRKVVLKSLNRCKTVHEIHAKTHAWRLEMELQS